jgi:hypothetical protein
MSKQKQVEIVWQFELADFNDFRWYEDDDHKEFYNFIKSIYPPHSDPLWWAYAYTSKQILNIFLKIDNPPITKAFVTLCLQTLETYYKYKIKNIDEVEEALSKTS